MNEEGRRGDLELVSLARVADIAAERHGDAVAICDGEVTLTYAELAARAHTAGRAMIAAGVEPGDRVAIWAPNIWEWIVCALGASRAGGVLVPINTRYKGEEAAYILRRSRARLLFTVTGFLGTDYVALLRARDGDQALPDLRGTVVLRGDAPAGARSWRSFVRGGADVPDATARARAEAVRSDDLADILFTSGTTGKPKGAMCTHAQTLRAFRDWADVVGLRAGDRYLVVAPFFHGFGYKAGWLAALMTGATIYPQAVFDADAVLERVARDRITVLPGPPALYQSFLARPDLRRYDLAPLRLAVTGAAAIPVELIRRMRGELGFDTVITGYGLTEATAIATMCRDGDDAETIATTSGRAIPGVEVRVVGDDGVEVAHGEPGEVVVRGYNVMRGYLDDPEATQAAIDGDGWLHTGDVGVMDERGYLRITDRKKDMFIVGGFNAYPAEIENTLSEHAAVAQVAVVGVPDERLGEVGCAFVVPRADAPVDPAALPETLIAWSKSRMANFKVPRRVEVVDALPMNASGKVLKYELRERARSEA